LPLRQGHFGERGVLLDSSIADKDVDCSVFPTGRQEEFLDLVFLAHIGLRRGGTPAGSPDFLDHPVRVFRPGYVIDRHVGPGGSHGLGYLGADTRVGFSDQCGLDLKNFPFVHVRPPENRVYQRISSPGKGAKGPDFDKAGEEEDLIGILAESFCFSCILGAGTDSSVGENSWKIKKT
jgi:hypothetical protein